MPFRLERAFRDPLRRDYTTQDRAEEGGNKAVRRLPWGAEWPLFRRLLLCPFRRH